MISKPQVEEIEHVIRHLTPIIRQRIRRRRVVADQGVHEETPGHSSTKEPSGSRRDFPCYGDAYSHAAQGNPTITEIPSSHLTPRRIPRSGLNGTISFFFFFVRETATSEDPMCFGPSDAFSSDNLSSFAFSDSFRPRVIFTYGTFTSRGTFEHRHLCVSFPQKIQSILYHLLSIRFRIRCIE